MTGTLAGAFAKAGTDAVGGGVTDAMAGAVAVVTGGGGGIGAAMCRRLASRGYAVAVADLDEAAARRVADAIGGLPVRVDVTSLADNQALVAAVLRHYGRLDLLVLNAGVNSGIPPGEPLDLDRYRRANAINVDGVVFGIDAAVSALSAPVDGLPGHGGAIAVTSSFAALAPQAANPVYTLGKSGIVGYLRALATPLARSGITINALCPSFTDTPMLRGGKPRLAALGIDVLAPDEVALALLHMLDAGRTGEAWMVLPGQRPRPYPFPDALALDAD